MSSRFEPNQYPLDGGVRLLEASAGTGKTFALAHLVLRLVTERKLNLKELLVVTFTEAAAAELRDRIGRRLNDALKALLQDQANDSDAQTNAPPPDAVMEEWLAPITCNPFDPFFNPTVGSYGEADRPLGHTGPVVSTQYNWNDRRLLINVLHNEPVIDQGLQTFDHDRILQLL